MEKRTIWVKPSTFAPEFEMIIPVPTDRDDEEYIDELLDGILNLVLTDYATITTDAWFGYNIQKMCSVSASMATLALYC